MELHSGELLQIIAVCAAAALLTEFIMWLWAFRNDSFRLLRVNLDRQARKLDEIKAQPHAPGPQGKAAKAKKIEKLERSIKMSMMKELNSVKLKQAFVMGGGLLLLFKLCHNWYGGHVVAKLPFEPFSLLGKLAHRGLESPEPDDCALAFIYALCQAGVRPTISKLLDLGMTRLMTDMGALQNQDWVMQQK